MSAKKTIGVAVTAVAAVAAAAVIASLATGFPANLPGPPAASPGAVEAGSGPQPTAEDRSATQAAEAFLADWVDDGRVVRRDQGDDTVSEGQAYGLLIAAGVGDEQAFTGIWDWTEANLQRPDGLLAWRWSDGEVVDAEPASDGDLDAARALVIAGKRFDEPRFTDAGVKLAGVIADRMTVETAAGRILLPGTWAAATEPYAYNPSYASPVAFSVLGAATGDPRWAELQAGSAAVTSALLDESPLPPDWAQVHADGTVDAMPGAAGTGQSVRYGYDAARLPIRYAESCIPADQATAARLVSTLARSKELRAETDLGGSPLTSDQHPLALEARAAARAAVGNLPEAADDLRAADVLAQEVPSYFGAAWAALAPMMLTTDDLDGCPPLTNGATS
ncbi:glycoside hydrolase [Plantibacter sp. VKM Ac-2880]|uniref:glycosyl hydrolase family 8 n=1 Tax=Plantibacter sp. VKM Ac-2880 TaxID=2783827 RepID=UPI00188F56A3|nr:glycosyl hydrolase family 8 [Plantibacter sp. VKM Ac-2880]MBF4568267.1 glycoside hydrolase [Plantibacter sp. VKM Ac-2880]